MSQDFDIRSTINKVLEAELANTPELIAETFTRISLYLNIPIRMADQRGSQARELEAVNTKLEQQVAECRAVLGDAKAGVIAGTSASYEVDDAAAQLDRLLKRIQLNNGIVDATLSYYGKVVEMANNILTSVKLS